MRKSRWIEWVEWSVCAVLFLFVIAVFTMRHEITSPIKGPYIAPVESLEEY